MVPARRSSVVDEIFLRTHRGLGTPIALQGLWRTADRVDPELLRQVHAALRVGPLGRRVIRPRVPGARRSWRANIRAHPLEFTDGTIAAADLLDWADEQGADLDPEYGPGWRLSTAALDDGGSIVSLTCSHALADGRALVLAVDDALGGSGSTTSPVRAMRPPDAWSRMNSVESTVSESSTESSAPESKRSGENDQATPPTPESNHPHENERLTGTTHDTARSVPTTGNTPTDSDPATDESAYPELPDRSNAGDSMMLSRASSTPTARGADRSDVGVNAWLGRAARDPVSDWSDAWRQWSIVVRGTFRALRHGIPERPARTASTRETGLSTRERRSIAGRASVDSASTFGFVLHCPATDWESAAAAQGGTANSLFITLIAKMLWASGFSGATIDASLPVDTRDEPRVDNDLAMTEITIERGDTPATIREKARIAYERRMSSPGGMPEELLQVIPDRWAYALSKGAGERDILCSNIGTLPDSLRTLGPHRCIGVAARAIHPGLTADRLPRTRLSGYLCRIADTYTLAIVSLDPAHIDTPETLHTLAHETATALGLPITRW
ncbi:MULTISPECIES: hypothetical protein [unclassified Nocardia]|uniref:hypothetical protein n=1 Tax=unclassified Nocardia TaxID=2637762 RepID=UPI0034305568